MIHSRLSTLLGERKLKMSVVARETGLARTTIEALYKESSVRVDFETLDRLCKRLGCGVGEILEFVPGETKEALKNPSPRKRKRTGKKRVSKV